MSCGKKEVFVRVGDIFQKSSTPGKVVEIPEWAGDKDCDTPQLKSIDGQETITVGQVDFQVNTWMSVGKLAPGKGKPQAVALLRKWGATDEDIKNLLG